MNKIIIIIIVLDREFMITDEWFEDTVEVKRDTIKLPRYLPNNIKQSLILQSSMRIHKILITIFSIQILFHFYKIILCHTFLFGLVSFLEISSQVIEMVVL